MMTVSTIATISYIIIGFIIGTFIVAYRPKKEDEEKLSLLAQLKQAVAPKPMDLIERALKTPDEDRSIVKNIIDVGNPLATPGVAIEVARFELPVVDQVSIDVLALSNEIIPKVGIGLAKDFKNLNMDIGIGVTKRLDKLLDSSKPDYMIYLGIHF